MLLLEPLQGKRTTVQLLEKNKFLLQNVSGSSKFSGQNRHLKQGQIREFLGGGGGRTSYFHHFIASNNAWTMEISNHSAINVLGRGGHANPPVGLPWHEVELQNRSPRDN